MRNSTGASAEPTGLSSPTEPSSTVSALTGFDPSRGARVKAALASSIYRGSKEREQMAADIQAALALLDATDRALRIRIWNECKDRGMRDDAAYSRIKEALAAIAIEAGTAATVKQGAVRSTKARACKASHNRRSGSHG